MIDPLVVLLVKVDQGAVGPLVDDVLGTLVDQRALRARERDFLVLGFKKVLADFRPDEFEQKPQVRQDGVVATNGLPGLQHVTGSSQGYQ